MIVTKTPFRISFFGGGTDYPQWYKKEGGAVLSTSINKHCYITCRVHPPIPNIRHRIVWSHIETPNSVEEVLHPAVREALIYLGFDDSIGVEVHHQGDLPARSGIGSSSSFAVGLIKALKTVLGDEIDRDGLVREATHLERDILSEVVGSQDQIAAAYGGLNVIQFGRDGTYAVTPIDAAPQRIRRLQERLMLFYIGSSRTASKIAADQVSNFGDHQETLRRMHRMVDSARSILEGEENLDAFGELLHEAWMNKRELSRMVSTPLIDHLYATARQHGALGGKLLGAGGTGFLLLYVPPENQHRVGRAFHAYSHVPFTFAEQGCELIFEGSEHMADNLRWCRDYLKDRPADWFERPS